MIFKLYRRFKTAEMNIKFLCSRVYDLSNQLTLTLVKVEDLKDIIDDFNKEIVELKTKNWRIK